MFFKNTTINIVKLKGVISSSKKALNLNNIKPLLDKAFGDKQNKDNKKIVALLINSPGGSPVQSEMIANYILKKSTQTNTEVISFVEDVSASGGYWLALAGSSIYALSKSSIVGSLGVLYTGFGLEDFIKKHAIKRRVYTAGTKKVSLDMFQEEKTEDILRIKAMLEEVHTHFKTWVLSRRESKITLNKDDLFTGEFWVASRGLEYGLIDAIAFDMEGKLKELYGKKAKINYIEPKKGLFSGFSLLGNKVVHDTLAEIKEQSYWHRFGL